MVDLCKFLKSVPGRLEFVENKNGALVYIDFAHTPDALKHLLKTLKKLFKGDLLLVFVRVEKEIKIKEGSWVL